MAEPFIETTTSLAGLAGCLPETIRLYGKLGLIESLTLPNGVQLFRRSSAPKVQQIRRERLARRGGYRPKREASPA